MKVVRLYDFTDIRVEEAPVPAIGPGELLVRARAAGICSGDVLPWYIEAKAPLVLGHEPAGEVVAVGPGVEGFAPGDRVFVHHHAPCLNCRQCRRGEPVQCPTWRSSRLDPGAMAEYWRVPAANLVDTLHLPDHLSFADGALVEPVACCVKALGRAGIRSGDDVLVIGLGIMGQLLARLSRSFGAGRVLTADFVAERRRMARRLGADAAFDPAKAPLDEQVRDCLGGRGADVVVVGPPTVAALEAGVSAAGQGAAVVLFSPAPPGAVWNVQPHRLYFDEIRLVPSYSCGPDDTQAALQLIADGAVTAREFVTHWYTLNEAPEAYRDMAAGGAVIKAMVLLGDHEEDGSGGG